MRKSSKILVSGLTALLLSFNAVPQTYIPDFLQNSRNFGILNQQNLGSTRYSVDRAASDDTQIQMRLKGYVFGFRVIRSDYVVRFNQQDYVAYADAKTSGLAALLKKMELWSVTKGRYSKNGLKPDWHVQQNTDKKNRRVEMNYDRSKAKVDVAIVPPLGSQGIPPATPAERYQANDAISGILHLMMTGTSINGELCTGRVPFFDSKQHYYLRLERIGTKRVKFLDGKDDTIHCRAYYEPVSGYDPEDLPSEEEASTPVNVYLKYFPEAGLHIPVRLTYKISAFKAVIKVDEMEIIQARQASN